MSAQTEGSYQIAISVVDDVARAGSGDVIIGGGFTPIPSIPFNNCNLPRPRSSNFVGRRTEIQKVMDALASDDWIVMIDGMGGIGKTTLALEIAYLCKEHRSKYPHIPQFTGYIWISAQESPDFCLDYVVKKILRVLGPFQTRTEQLTPSEELNLAVRMLAVEPFLLIIDNLQTVRDEPLDELLRFLRDQFPDPSKALLITRHHIHIQAGERRITLRGLKDEDAAWLLRLEAESLEIPLDEQAAAALEIIAQKSYGIPLVLRWVMERVYDGKSYDWVLQSLQAADEEYIFKHIFSHSISTLDLETRRVFCSMSLLPTWSRIEAIAALNPDVAAIQDHVSSLVSLSLLEDNRSLVQGARRFKLPKLAWHLACRELAGTEDGGRGSVEGGLKYYLSDVQGFEPHSEGADAYLRAEFTNVRNIVRVASKFEDPVLLKQCVELAERVSELTYQYGQTLFACLAEPIVRAGDEVLALSLLSAMGSPYVIGRPALPPMFFGREALVRFIRERFEADRMHASVVSLVGLRRIGKTSILLHLRRQAPSRCIYAFVNLQGAVHRGTAGLSYYIARSLGHELAGMGLEVVEPRDQEFVDRPYEALDDYMGDVLSSLSSRRLVLMLDEFDVLFGPVDTVRMDTESLLAYLRARVQTGTFGIIVSGVRPLYELPSSVAGHPFFGLAVSKRVPCLGREAAGQLMQQPTRGLIKYDERSVEYLLQLTGCHPHVLQLVCDSIVELCCEQGRLQVDLEMVESVVPFVFEQYFFHELMGQWEDDERAVLQAAASIVDTSKGGFTIDRLQETLDIDAPKISWLENSLSRLVRGEILAVDHRGNYGFTMEIFRRWVVERAA